MAKTSELRAREIVNILDGKKMGYPTDLEIDPHTGRITALVAPGTGKFFWLFGKHEEIVIPWNKIIRIGQDVILVELPEHADGAYIDLSSK
ncbi:MAG TPA: YlmC/YmxH family sporulation protein [Bacillota bacterium]